MKAPFFLETKETRDGRMYVRMYVCVGGSGRRFALAGRYVRLFGGSFFFFVNVLYDIYQNTYDGGWMI
jgi:hypothetical protein